MGMPCCLVVPRLPMDALSQKLSSSILTTAAMKGEGLHGDGVQDGFKGNLVGLDDLD